MASMPQLTYEKESSISNSHMIVSYVILDKLADNFSYEPGTSFNILVKEVGFCQYGYLQLNLPTHNLRLTLSASAYCIFASKTCMSSL